MKTIFKSLSLFLGGALCLFILFALRPVPQATANNTSTDQGIMTNVKEGSGEKDIVLKLADSDVYYYINRGLERGLTIEDLSQKTVGKKVAISYVQHFSSLNLKNQSRHVAKLSVGQEVLFSEMK